MSEIRGGRDLGVGRRVSPKASLRVEPAPPLFSCGHASVRVCVLVNKSCQDTGPPGIWSILKTSLALEALLKDLISKCTGRTGLSALAGKF